MFKLRTAVIASCCLLPFWAMPARATASFSSGAYDMAVNLSTAGTVTANAGTGAVSGTAPAAYSRTGGAASVNQSFTLTGGGLGLGLLGTARQGLQTGLVSTSASSGAPGQTIATATATATLANVGSGLTNQLLGSLVTTNLLNLGASAISSTTTAGLDATGLFSTGSSRIEGLSLTGSLLGSLAIDGNLYANAAANTVLLSLAGLTVMLNEQISTRTGDGLTMQTNAVHVSFDNYALNGTLLSGDIILGHSQASVAGVPEPVSWALMIVGMGAIGGSLRRKRGQTLFV